MKLSGSRPKTKRSTTAKSVPLEKPGRRPVAQHLRLAVGVALRPLADLHRRLARLDPHVLQRGLVAPVLVHRHDSVARVHDVRIGHRHLLRSVATGAARTVKLADVLTVEAVDLDGTVAVVLDDLVVGVASATADDLGHTGGGAALDTQRVLTHVVPPDVLNDAVVLIAVDALHLVLADDGVLECGTGSILNTAVSAPLSASEYWTVPVLAGHEPSGTEVAVAATTRRATVVANGAKDLTIVDCSNEKLWSWLVCLTTCWLRVELIND
ncbi:hypothetical protein GQ600_20887 [Phytophthora cactorum]|nr:hypothetical protein GQ600_20887 [Phytophthora cactorum]